jgi:hypothetical protein
VGGVVRPRIRTLKPEVWQNEKVGALNHTERVLFVGLITMADDDGRLRALPSAVGGHVFPYDDLSPKRIGSLLERLEEVGLVRLYEYAGKPYAWIVGWSEHQKINRKTDSKLPEPSLNGHGATNE